MPTPKRAVSKSRQNIREKPRMGIRITPQELSGGSRILFVNGFYRNHYF